MDLGGRSYNSGLRVTDFGRMRHHLQSPCGDSDLFREVHLGHSLYPSLLSPLALRSRHTMMEHYQPRPCLAISIEGQSLLATLTIICALNELFFFFFFFSKCSCRVFPERLRWKLLKCEMIGHAHTCLPKRSKHAGIEISTNAKDRKPPTSSWSNELGFSLPSSQV